MIEEADIVGDWQRPSFDVGAAPSASSTATGWSPTARSAWADRGRRRRAPRPPRPRASAPRSPRWMQDRARAAGASPRSGCRCRWARPATGCSPRSATTCAGRAGGSSCPRAPTVPERDLPDGLRRPRGRPPPSTSSAGPSRRTRSSSGPQREREPFEDWLARTVRPARLRAVEPPGGRRPRGAVVAMAGVHRRRRSRRSSPGWPPAATSAAAASPRRCWSTRSRSPGRTAPPAPSSRPDSRTGALGLYEKVGMRVVTTWVNRAIDL